MKDRRQFLQGLAATVAFAGFGAVNPIRAAAMDLEIEQYRQWLQAWMKDLWPVFEAHRSNVIVFGIGALQETTEYPYLRSVLPSEMLIDAPTVIEFTDGYPV